MQRCRQLKNKCDRCYKRNRARGACNAVCNRADRVCDRDDRLLGSSTTSSTTASTTSSTTTETTTSPYTSTTTEYTSTTSYYPTDYYSSSSTTTDVSINAHTACSNICICFEKSSVYIIAAFLIKRVEDIPFMRRENASYKAVNNFY